MNPETPQTPREKLEMRLTALLMGELPPEEAAAIRALMAADPALAALHERLRGAFELLREASALAEPPAPPAPVQLSSERREKLLAHFKTAAPASASPPAPAPIAKLPRRNWTWIVPTGIAAAVIAVLGAGLLLPTFSSVRESYSSAKMSTSSHPVAAFDTVAGLVLQSTPSPTFFTGTTAAPNTVLPTVQQSINVRGVGLIESEDTRLRGHARGTFNLLPPSGNVPGFTKSGSGAEVLPPSPAVVTFGSTAGIYLPSAPPVITSSNAGNQQLQNESPSDPNLTIGGTIWSDKSGDLREDQKMPFLNDLNGQGNIVLSGANTYTGGTTITAGGLYVGQAVSGAPVPSDTTIFINGGGGVTLNGGNTSIGATAGAGTVTITAGGTLETGGSNGGANADYIRFAGAAQNNIAFTNPTEVVNAAQPKPADISFGNSTLSLGSSNVSANTAVVNANTAFNAASDTLNLTVGGIVSGSNQDKPSAKKPFTLAGNGSIDSAGDFDTGTGKSTADSPLTFSGNIAIGAGPVRIDYGAPIQVPSPVPTPRAVPVSGKTQSPAKLESAAAGEATEAERTQQYWRTKHLSAGEAATAGSTTTTTGAGKNQVTKTTKHNLEDVTAQTQATTRIARIEAELKEEDTSKETPRQQPTAKLEFAKKAIEDEQKARADYASAKLEAAKLEKKMQSVEKDSNPVEPELASQEKESEDGGNTFVSAYATAQQGEKALDAGNYKLALNKLHEAARQFDTIARKYPTWSPAIVNYRKEHTAEAIARAEQMLGRSGPGQEGAPKEGAPVSKPEIPAATPQPEVLTRDNAFSTFSLNVSDVSFKLAAANLEQGRMPDPSSIRSEEFVNAFDYRDPEPAPGAPLAFASERARYPFAQNRDLLRFSVKTAAAGRQPGRPLNIVLLLDKSGSMERADRVNIVREALRVLAAQLQPQDKLSIVTFARTPRLWADGVAGNKVAEMIARVSEITPEGGTNLEAALDLGYATALRYYSVGSISRVVLFTDGAANLGDVDPAALTQKVETHRKKGVALDCFGIGWEGYNDDLLEQLTRHGDGRYGFINTPEEAAANFAAQLAGALQIAASDVKTQVEFNPRRVKAYRQIGYAKHQLTKEQFRDNTVNAAQIGAAESGNALYVVEVDPRGEGDLATVRVRFRVPGTNDYREHEWAVPFNGNAPPLEQSSPAMRLAGTAAAFSEMLAASPYAAEVTSDHLLGLLNGVPATYGADPRPKELEWMIRQVKNLSGH